MKTHSFASNSQTNTLLQHLMLNDECMGMRHQYLLLDHKASFYAMQVNRGVGATELLVHYESARASKLA